MRTVRIWCGRPCLARVCKSKSQPQPAPQGKSTKRTTSQPVRQLDEEYDSDTDDSMQPILTIGQRRDGRTPPIKVQVEVDKVSISMEIDTGACVSIISENRYHKLWPGRSLSTSTIRLQTYSKEPITVVGSTDVQVVYQGQTAILPLVVVKGDGPTLLGRNWLTKIKLNWDKIITCRAPSCMINFTEPV